MQEKKDKGECWIQRIAPLHSIVSHKGQAGGESQLAIFYLG